MSKVRVYRVVECALLIALLSSCGPHKSMVIEFEGVTPSGQLFRINRMTSWLTGHLQSPYEDRLCVNWPSSAQRADNLGGGPTMKWRAADLVPRIGEEDLSFSVRSEGTRIWLVDRIRSVVIAAVDFGESTVYPESGDKPGWATPHGGTPLENIWPAEPPRDPHRTYAAPDFTLRQLDGQTFTLSAAVRHHVVVLNFFGVGCRPCQVEAPHLVSLQNKYRDAGLLVVSVNAWNDWKISVKSYARRHSLNFPVLLRGKSVARMYGVTGLPETVWINRDGQVVDSYSGFSADSSGELESRTRKVLGLDASAEGGLRVNPPAARGR